MTLGEIFLKVMGAMGKGIKQKYCRDQVPSQDKHYLIMTP